MKAPPPQPLSYSWRYAEMGAQLGCSVVPGSYSGKALPGVPCKAPLFSYTGDWVSKSPLPVVGDQHWYVDMSHYLCHLIASSPLLFGVAYSGKPVPARKEPSSAGD